MLKPDGVHYPWHMLAHVDATHITDLCSQQSVFVPYRLPITPHSRLLSLNLPANEGFAMNTQKSIGPITILPPKFWAATKNMSSAQVECLMDAILESANNGDIDSLATYDFLVIGKTN